MKFLGEMADQTIA